MPLFLVPGKRRAPDLQHAFAAARAGALVEANRLAGLDEFHAGAFEDDRGRAIELDGLAGSGTRPVQMQRVGVRDNGDAQRTQNSLDADGLRLRPHQRDACSRVRLRTGHGGGGVVQHAHRDVVLVVHRVGDARHATGEEGGIAHEGECLLARLDHRKALGNRDARAHAQAGVHRIKRLGVAQRVAADVAAEDAVAGLAQGGFHRIERAAMRAARAQHRRARGSFGGRLAIGQRCSRGAKHLFRLGKLNAEERTQLGGDGIHRVLAPVGGLAGELAVHGIARTRCAGELEHLVFQNVVQLLEADHVGKAFGEPGGSSGRERIRGSHLHNAVGRQGFHRLAPSGAAHGAVAALAMRRQNRGSRRTFSPDQLPLGNLRFQQAKRLARIGVRNTAGNDAERRSLPHLQFVVELVIFSGREIACDLRQALVDFPMALERALGEDNPLRVALKAFGLARLGFLGNVDIGRGMADSRGGAHDNRRAVLLGKVVGSAHHGAALLGRCRVEHRHLRELGEAAGVLLGLRRDGARVVGHVEHGAALHAHVVQRHKRVTGNIQAHLFAGVQGARTGVGSASQQLQRRLFVGRPFNMHALGAPGRVFGGDGLYHLGRRSARIARAYAHARFEGSMGKGLVALQEFFRHEWSFRPEPYRP